MRGGDCALVVTVTALVACSPFSGETSGAGVTDGGSADGPDASLDAAVSDGGAETGSVIDSGVDDGMVAPAGVTFVKNVGAVHDTSGGATALNVTVPAEGCAAGHLLVARFATATFVSGVSFGDSAGNVWHKDFDLSNSSIGVNQVWSIRLTNALAAGQTITAKFQTGGAPYTLVVDELSGEMSSPPIAVDAAGKTDVGNALSQPSDQLTVTVPKSRTKVLVIGVVYTDQNNAYTNPPDPTGGDTWHALTADFSVATFGLGSHAAYKVIGSSNSITYAPTFSSAQVWVETIVAY